MINSDLDFLSHQQLFISSVCSLSTTSGSIDWRQSTALKNRLFLESSDHALPFTHHCSASPFVDRVALGSSSRSNFLRFSVGLPADNLSASDCLLWSLRSALVDTMADPAKRMGSRLKGIRQSRLICDFWDGWVGLKCHC